MTTTITIDKKVLQDLLNLAKDLGVLVRLLDEEGDHSEMWTQDGDYIVEYRFEAAEKALKETP